MNFNRKIVGILLGVGLLWGLTCSAKEEWFVATTGNDRNPGTVKRPFATLARARDAVRKSRVRTQQPITVWIARGTYRLTESLEFTPKDSGTADAPVIWRAAKGERVQISGGQVPEDWKVLRNSKLLKRLDPVARGKVVQTQLSNFGITDYNSKNFPVELFFAGKIMTPARWPNEDWMRIGELPDGSKGSRFKVDSDHLKRWVAEKELWAYGYWYYLWSDAHLKIINVDPVQQELTLEGGGRYGLRTGQPFRVENVFSELDQPGEWYLNHETGELYFWPPKRKKGDGLPVISVLKKPLFMLNNTLHLIIHGLTFMETRGTAILIRNANACQIDQCGIRNIGGLGIDVQGGHKNRITRCEITQTGNGAIALSGGKRKTLERGENEVVDCHLHHYARLKQTYQAAVKVSGVGNRVANCEMHHAPHVALLYSGNDHLFEYNAVHDVCLVTADAGAFYTGRDWTARDTLIRFNHFYNIGLGDGKKQSVHAVYFDDSASGNIVRSNIFEGGHRTVLIGGGRDHLVEGNLFIDCDYAISIDARGIEKHQNEEQLRQRLTRMPYTTPPWSEHYPALVAILDNNPLYPKGNIIRHNVFVGDKEKSIMFRMRNPAYKALVKIEDNWFGHDPKFVSRSTGNYKLTPNSPARASGYKDIPANKIGIQKR